MIKMPLSHFGLLTLRSLVLVGSIVLGSVSLSQNVYAGAACIPGLPCETAPSGAQLQDPHTGPNATKSGDSTVSTATNPNETRTCDANFMNQIYAKAFLEAERETVITNTLILKPDSVLEYSCFDQRVAAVAEDAGPIFSESDRWSTATIPINGGLSVSTAGPSSNVPDVDIDVNMGNTRLDGSVERLVLEALVEYANGSFSYDFLGNTATGDNNTFSASVAGVSGVCDFMFNMYHISKCDDFALNAPFMHFEAGFGAMNLASTDPRTIPASCPSTHAITSAVIDVAQNQSWNYASFDPVDPLLTLTNPSDGSTCETADPIPTGVMVTYVQYGVDPAGNPIVTTPEYIYEDKVCPNPACYFENNDNASGGDDTCEPN